MKNTDKKVRGIEKNSYRTFIIAGMFAIAMGLLEAIVVVYLRAIYYPDGFDFPLKDMPTGMISIEVIRELCTMVMLLSVAFLSAKKRLLRFSWFIFTFGLWDIFYYIGLKFFLNWPESWLTFDILFLFPVPWVGPVLSPIICSLTMMLLAAVIIQLETKGYQVQFRRIHWILLFSGGSLILISFIKDHVNILLKKDSLFKFLTMAKDFDLQRIFSNYQPDSFAWFLFLLGEACILAAIIWMIHWTIRKQQMLSQQL